MTTEIGRVKGWSSTEGLRQKEVLLDRETGMVYNVKTTTTTTAAPGSGAVDKLHQFLFFCIFQPVFFFRVLLDIFRFMIS